ncbi:MAG: MBL fold metallo-hydrolase [Alteromonadaceae bacterium]|nr:MBL fold metallo-hydrolase [Alteromonadaceae bacterium]
MVRIQSFFHEQSNTFSYLLWGEDKHAVVIDSALDFDMFTGEIDTTSADEIVEMATREQLTVNWLLETHIHADHISAASYLKKKLQTKIGLSEELISVRSRFQPKFANASDRVAQASIDEFFKDGDLLRFGENEIQVLSTPGHTPDSVSFYVCGNIFVGDTLFMPDSGTARCDFPQGSASVLFDSIQKLYHLSDDTVVWMCHDYGAGGRDFANRTSIGECKQSNIHITANTSRDEFVSKRESRDKTLSAPKLLLPSIQMNIAAGATEYKNDYLAIPMTFKGGFHA